MRRCARSIPRIVYCSVSGYGQSGPRRDWPAIDNIVQATSGMMSLGGDPDGPPMRVGFPVVDTLTGQTAAFAILAALLRRERGGGGDYIDVAMFDASARLHGVGGGALPGDRQGAGAHGQHRLQRPTDLGAVRGARWPQHLARRGAAASVRAAGDAARNEPQWLADPRFARPGDAAAERGRGAGSARRRACADAMPPSGSSC